MNRAAVRPPYWNDCPRLTMSFMSSMRTGPKSCVFICGEVSREQAKPLIDKKYGLLAESMGAELGDI